MRRQLELAPPLHVGEIPERAAHRDAGALVRLGGRVREHRDLDVEQRVAHGGAEQPLIPLVVRVRDERDHGGDQLGPGGLDVDRRTVVHGVERDPVEVPGVLAGLELGLGDGGLEGHVPQARCLGLVRLAACQVEQERALGDGARALVDGLVVVRPVDREAQMPPQGLELLLVLDREPLAQLDEVAPRDRDLVGRLDALALAADVRRGERVLVGQRRVAAHAEVVLHAALGGQAVVVPAHRVEHLAAAHPLEAGDHVGVGVAEHVTHVQRAGDRRRRGVDRVHLLAGLRAVERVGALLAPGAGPLLLEPVQADLVRYARRRRGSTGRWSGAAGRRSWPVILPEIVSSPRTNTGRGGVTRSAPVA